MTAGYKRDRDPLRNIPRQDELSYIPDPGKPKSREYERKRPAFQYRLTDKEIGQRISAIAYKENLTVDDVARIFLERALEHIHEIPFDKAPVHNRRASLYPKDGSAPTVVFEVKEDGWPISPPPLRPGRAPARLSSEERKRLHKERNQYLVAYRWPAELDQAIKAVATSAFGKPASRADGRTGWVLTILLRYALARYYAGRWLFKPRPETVRMGAELVEQ